MKFECIFASDTTPRVIASIRLKEGNLYPFGCVVNANILPSVSYCGPLSPCEIGYTLAGIGKQTASFVFIHNSNFFRKMPRCEEVCGGRNHSTPHARGGKTTSAYIVTHGSRCPLSTQITVLEKSLESLRRELLSEVREKNIAYSFILGSGSLESFRDFHRNYHKRDPHKDCVRGILSTIKKANKSK